MSRVDPARLAPLLLPWFDAHQRALPWRGTRDPYRVWVSEVMLQQTRVETVLKHYERFLARFPRLEDLARAAEDEVLAAWSGLGFYRRARNLHRAAREVVRAHGGRLPRDPAALRRLPGFGRYTVGAVLSIAHDMRLPVLDGNVIRVVSRLLRSDADPRRAAGSARLWAFAEEALPAERCGDFNQALMELGALVCRPQAPGCGDCPLGAVCAAKAAGDPEDYPRLGSGPSVPEEERVALYLERSDGRFLIERRPPTGLLASLWELPSAPSEGSPVAAVRALARARGARGRPAPAGVASHRFSHRLWTVRVYVLATRARAAVARGTWVREEELSAYGVPTATRKVLAVARRHLDLRARAPRRRAAE
ncbi:MAG: A/G-specific adenine glycosylase [Planctomycetota bacterium]|nr:MAG: A/G-specific adenine glycosylase [Planctomycetota bacterium]